MSLLKLPPPPPPHLLFRRLKGTHKADALSFWRGPTLTKTHPYGYVSGGKTSKIIRFPVYSPCNQLQKGYPQNKSPIGATSRGHLCSCIFFEATPLWWLYFFGGVPSSLPESIAGNKTLANCLSTAKLVHPQKVRSELHKVFPPESPGCLGMPILERTKKHGPLGVVGEGVGVRKNHWWLAFFFAGEVGVPVRKKRHTPHES